MTLTLPQLVWILLAGGCRDVRGMADVHTAVCCCDRPRRCPVHQGRLTLRQQPFLLCNLLRSATWACAARCGAALGQWRNDQTGAAVASLPRSRADVVCRSRSLTKPWSRFPRQVYRFLRAPSLPPYDLHQAILLKPNVVGKKLRRSHFELFQVDSTTFVAFSAYVWPLSCLQDRAATIVLLRRCCR